MKLEPTVFLCGNDGDQLLSEPLALITAIATALLFIVNWRAANAAKQNADIAAREFRLLRRPLVTVTWGDNPPAIGDTVFLYAKVTEVAGIATTLHSVEASAKPVFSPPTPTVANRAEPNATLSGDVATSGVGLNLEVPKWMRDPNRPRELPPDVRAALGGRAAATGLVAVANLSAIVTISVADEEAVQEVWQTHGVLHFDRDRQRYVAPEKTHMSRVAGRERRRRSRLIDPVLRAWERWWNSVC